MTKRITTQDKEVIRELYDNGLSLKDIGHHLSANKEKPVSKQTVWYHVQKMELERPEDPDRALQREYAEELLSSTPDMTIKALSEDLDISWQLAKTLMTELGYYKEPVPFVERVNADRLIRLYVIEDMSLSDLSNVFPDVSEMTLSKTLKELGVPMRPQGASSGDLRTDWRKEAMTSLGLSPAPENLASA